MAPGNRAFEKMLDAIQGPYCKECSKHRTRNPSKVCAPCLGPDCCFTCKGQGQYYHPDIGVPMGCEWCSGTGRRSQR